MELLVINELLCIRKHINISKINLQARDNNLQSLEICKSHWRKKSQVGIRRHNSPINLMKIKLEGHEEQKSERQ